MTYKFQQVGITGTSDMIFPKFDRTVRIFNKFDHIDEMLCKWKLVGILVVCQSFDHLSNSIGTDKNINIWNEMTCFSY